MRVYLDTSVLIYLVEEVEPFFPLARQKLTGLACERIVSELSRMELLV